MKTRTVVRHRSAQQVIDNSLLRAHVRRQLRFVFYVDIALLIALAAILVAGFHVLRNIPA